MRFRCEIVFWRWVSSGSSGRVESGRAAVLSVDGERAVQHRERERRAVLDV